VKLFTSALAHMGYNTEDMHLQYNYVRTNW